LTAPGDKMHTARRALIMYGDKPVEKTGRWPPELPSDGNTAVMQPASQVSWPKSARLVGDNKRCFVRHALPVNTSYSAALVET